MDNANNSSIILGLNKQDQIKALRDVGFTDIADNATWSDIVNHMRWAGGLRDLQVATYLKTSLRDPSPQRSYFSEDQWQTMTVNERSKFVPFGVAIRAERMAFVLSLQNAKSDSTIRFVWGPTNINVPGLKDFSNKNEGVFEDVDAPVPLIGDMSSDIFSRPVDVAKYDCIYAGAQKNLSMAGVTLVIVKNEALGKVDRVIPTMLDYRTHVEKGSMFNTPPVLPIYTALETLRWIKRNGGVEEMDRRAHERAELLYAEIDRNKLFRGTVAKEDRSLMNICFVMNDEYKELEKPFFEFATSQGMVGIKGHRSVGGFRASCYNAMSVEGVKALVKCMQEFEAQH